MQRAIATLLEVCVHDAPNRKAAWYEQPACLWGPEPEPSTVVLLDALVQSPAVRASQGGWSLMWITALST